MLCTSTERFAQRGTSWSTNYQPHLQNEYQPHTPDSPRNCPKQKRPSHTFSIHRALPRRRAHLVLLLRLIHDLHQPGHILRAGQAKCLYYGVVDGVIEYRVEGALVRGRLANVVAEYFAHTEDACCGADGRPEGGGGVSWGINIRCEAGGSPLHSLGS
jgi:hypothetical protein